MPSRISDRFLQWWRARAKHRVIYACAVCLTMALLIAICTLADRMELRDGWRRDYSFNLLTTHTDATLEVLSKLTCPVEIHAVFGRGQEDQPLLELLNRYSAASDFVTWDQIDISMNPYFLERYRTSSSDQVISSDGSIIVECEDTGRFRILGYEDFLSVSYNPETGLTEPSGIRYEASITNAINFVVQETIPRVMILQGHGELDENSTAAFASLLTDNNLDVSYYSLNSGNEILTTNDLLVIFSPQRDFTDTEMASIVDFIQQGGSILMTCDFSDDITRLPHYVSLMRSYGFLPKDGVVVESGDDNSKYYDDYRVYIIPTMQSTEITAELIEAHSDLLLLPGARGFAMPETTDRNLEVSAVLTSGPRAYSAMMTEDRSSMEQQENDEMGPFALALQARRITTDGFISRAFVSGCSTMLTSSSVWSMTDAQELIIHVVDYLLDTKPTDLGIMAKSAIRPMLSVRSLSLGVALCIALPVIVLCIAFIVVTRRRNL